jgi:hypothetical protein
MFEALFRSTDRFLRDSLARLEIATIHNTRYIHLVMILTSRKDAVHVRQT